MGGIPKLGIPTRNRTKSLDRCLRSFLDHFRNVRRDIDILIVDNSLSADQATDNRTLVSVLSSEYGTPLRYIDRSGRAQWADRIARKLGISEEITRFALIGDIRCSDSYGACRNTLLLDAVGQMSIQTDDDTVCLIGASPLQVDGLALSIREDPNTYHYFSNQESALNSVEYGELDLFSIHESFLGQAPIDLLGKNLSAGCELDISQASPELIRCLDRTDARVLTTFLGVVGDAGTQYHTGRLFRESQSLQSYWESTEKLQMALSTRWIRKNVNRNTLVQGSQCMTIHMGLDTRKMLPPFMPVLRNEDGVFGSLCNACFPRSFSAYLANLIQHAPLEKRKKPTPEEVISLPGIRTNDIVSQIVLYAREYCESLSQLGAYFAELSTLPLVEFEHLLQDRVNHTRENVIAYAQHLLKAHTDAPLFWRACVLKHIRLQEATLTDSNTILPTDLSGSEQDRLLLLQHLILQYGLLLSHWEAIYEAGSQISAI